MIVVFASVASRLKSSQLLLVCSSTSLGPRYPEGPRFYPEREERFGYAAQQLSQQPDGGQGPNEMYPGSKRVGESDWGQGKRKRKGAASFSVSQ